jgi:hypothetical protein
MNIDISIHCAKSTLQRRLRPWEEKTVLAGFTQPPFNLKKKPRTQGTDYNQNNSDDGQHSNPTQDFMGHGGLQPDVAGMAGKNWYITHDLAALCSSHQCSAFSIR